MLCTAHMIDGSVSDRGLLLTLTQDKELRDNWKLAMCDDYTPPEQYTLTAHIVKLAVQGQQKILANYKLLTQHGMTPGISGDNWSRNEISQLGLEHYNNNITDDWIIEE